MQYGQYWIKKKEMDKRNPPGHCNEKLLWHGTSVDTCPKINSQSFNRNFAGQHGKIYYEIWNAANKVYCMLSSGRLCIIL